MRELSFALKASLLGLILAPSVFSFDMDLDKGIRRQLHQVVSQSHSALDYTSARKKLLGDIHLERDGKGYYVEDVYCHQQFRNRVGPGQIPPHEQINVEHTWPQSRFNRGESKSTQKSDLHHLFPTNSQANSTRGNHIFADVRGSEPTNNCDDSAIGRAEGTIAFMPPEDHKGNVARALFYFAVRYNLNISELEEFYLRQWHLFDPVDSAEIARNDEIEKIQGNRNPFIDNPELVGSIRNF